MSPTEQSDPVELVLDELERQLVLQLPPTNITRYKRESFYPGGIAIHSTRCADRVVVTPALDGTGVELSRCPPRGQVYLLASVDYCDPRLFELVLERAVTAMREAEECAPSETR